MDLISDHISHRFGALAVLDDVSFTVRAGEVVAIVGPSGCGKSTLLSILGGLLQPSGGRAEWRGAPPPGSLKPLSALDSQTRELLMEDFVRLLGGGAMGAVYVTHNLEEAVRLADRIVVLSRRPGKVREVVAIPLTRGERGDITAREKLLALQSDLWSLIREEAIDAEREVLHA